MNKTAAVRSQARRAALAKGACAVKQATPLYTDEEDVKNYNRRKLIRRALLTAVGAGLGMGIGNSAANPFTGRGGHPFLGAGIGAGAAFLGSLLSDKYYESAGLDPTVPSLKARVQTEAIRPSSGTKKAAEAASPNYIHPYLLGTSNTLVELDDQQAGRLLALGASLKRISPEEERKHWIARSTQLSAKAKPAAAGAKKAAEAAYAEGFCKAAEIAGVDPSALYKAAFSVGDVVRMGSRVWNGLRGAGTTAVRAVRHPQRSFSRLMELGAGGRKATQKPLADFVNASGTKWDFTKRFFGGLTGARSRELARAGASTWDVNRMRAAEREFRKSMAAGVGVPVLAGMGLVNGIRSLRGGNEPQPQPYQGS